MIKLTSLLWMLLIGSELFGITLDNLLTHALDKNPSLESIAHKISANKSAIHLSRQFSNPTLAFSTNSIDENQAMSQKTVEVTQKISYYGKRNTKEAISHAQDGILNERLSLARVNLVLAIKRQAYTIWELESLYKIICDYEDITQQNIELFESYTTTSSDQHMGIMSAELTLSDLKIQKSELHAKIVTAYAELSYFASTKVNNLELILTITTLPTKKMLHNGLVNNRSLALKEKEIIKSSAVIKNSEINNYPDFNLRAGYSFRRNFEDYMSLGVGMTLPIYNSENYQEEVSRQEKLVVQSLKHNTQIAIDSKFDANYAQMQSAYKIYHIINDDALPQIEHMFELTNAAISTGADLFKYIDILVKKLKLEQKSITTISNYYKLNANIEALSGVTQ
jgi:outer membrane protein, heavy metal efflux system